MFRRTDKNTILFDACDVPQLNNDKVDIFIMYRENFIIINELKKYIIDKFLNKEYDFKSCVICNEDFKDVIDAYLCQCGFLFCEDCKENMRKNYLYNCPQCKQPILFLTKIPIVK